MGYSWTTAANTSERYRVTVNPSTGSDDYDVRRSISITVTPNSACGWSVTGFKVRCYPDWINQFVWETQVTGSTYTLYLNGREPQWSQRYTYLEISVTADVVFAGTGLVMRHGDKIIRHNHLLDKRIIVDR